MSGILCCVVARGTTILAKYAAVAGNFSEICDLVLARITPGDSRMSLSHGEYQYHYTSKAGVIIMAIAEAGFDRAVVFSFLDRLAEKFSLQYGVRAQSAIAYAMNTEFSLEIANEMKRANSPQAQDKITNIQDEVEHVKGIMTANIDVIMERGEKLDLLIDKTENLSANSVTFRTTSRNLQRSMWLKNMKLTIGAGLGVIVFIYIIVSFSCGGLSWPKCV